MPIQNVAYTPQKISFLNDLRKKLHESRAVTHPFFQKFRMGSYQKEALKPIFREMYVLFWEIPKANLCLAANVEDPVAIEAIRTHMIVELGAEELDKATHIALYRRFLYALGVKRHELDSYSGLPTSRAMREGLRFISEFESPAVAMGGFLCTETIAAPVQQALFQGLHSYCDLRREDLYYFDLHSRIEVEHSDMVCDYISSFIETEEGRTQVTKGATRLSEIYANYWTGIESLAEPYLNEG